MSNLDPYQRAPDEIRNVYKKYQRMKLPALDHDRDVVDLSSDRSDTLPAKVRVVKEIDSTTLQEAVRKFSAQNLDGVGCNDNHVSAPVPVYEHEDMPGLMVVPSLLPRETQSQLLSRLLHRDFSNKHHLTNIHAHYNVSYPESAASFFSVSPSSPTTIAMPIDANVHKSLTVAQLLNKKMRWSTLGGQYDWTAKRYPDTVPPGFPLDIKVLLETIFPDTKAEAAIVNLYSPGDTLSVHRDVAEDSPNGLVSISLGCDAIFVIGTSHGHAGDCKVVTLRLRSGGAVYMCGDSRFAWHGVPQIVPNTCPHHLQEWPGGSHSNDDAFQEWTGWMSSKRVNLNVRQMWETF